MSTPFNSIHRTRFFNIDNFFFQLRIVNGNSCFKAYYMYLNYIIKSNKKIIILIME